MPLRMREIIGAFRNSSGEIIPQSLEFPEVPDFPEIPAPTINTNTSLIRGSGRVYCRTTLDWVATCDDNYGDSYYQFNEYCGITAEPIIEWEHKGAIIPAGYRVKKLIVAGDANSTSSDLADMEIFACAKRPDPITRWKTGMDNDGERVFDILHHDDFLYPTDGEQFSGDIRDTHAREIALDYAIPELSMLCLYFKPKGILLGQRYFRTSYLWELEKL